LHVFTEAQDIGFAKQLTCHALNSLNLDEDKALGLEVFFSNHKAIGFYESKNH